MTIDPTKFRFPPAFAAGIRGKNVLITGAGKNGGLGQAFALAAGLNGAASVGVHFHRSYADGLATVGLIRAQGGSAFPVQADVTSPADVWATRSYVMRKMGGTPPDVVICNSGLSERGYLLGRVPKEVAGEDAAMRRARARQSFVDNLNETRTVVDTKVDGFLAMTHLWAGEAVHAGRPLGLVYISSRQAIEPGAGVPGYVAANWAVLSLPEILGVNLGKSAALVSSLSVAYPFVRTSMTEAFAQNVKVFGRWQPRMLETHEAALALLELLARPAGETNAKAFELDVSADGDAGAGAVRLTWAEMRFRFEKAPLAWSADAPIRCGDGARSA
jgi:NAD(P)-dependent dehydrogenase (short-subunit alcohol dehydrogenase family)